MRSAIILALFSALALWLEGGCFRHTQLFVPSPENHFFAGEIKTRPHHVYLPADHTSTGDRKWPIIVYLHGGGERGRDGVLQTQVGLGPVVWKSEGRFPYIVIFPQTSLMWAMPEVEAYVLTLLDEVIKKYNGDPLRVVLTGNSMGGYGTWYLGARYPTRFRALIPICGGVIPPRGVPVDEDTPFVNEPDPNLALARALGATPVWAFHGDADWMVKPKNTRDLVAALKRIGGNVRYTEYRGVGHDADRRAYAEPGLWRWVEEQLR